MGLQMKMGAEGGTAGAIHYNQPMLKELLHWRTALPAPP